MRYIRFVVSRRDEDSGFRQGVIQAVYELVKSGRLSRYEEELVRETEQWLGAHLARPIRFARKRNVSHRRTHGLSWFKDTATEHLRRIRSLVGLLEEHGVPVEMVMSERPGYIVYEDEFQVVAEPFGESGA